MSSNQGFQILKTGLFLPPKCWLDGLNRSLSDTHHNQLTRIHGPCCLRAFVDLCIMLLYSSMIELCVHYQLMLLSVMCMFHLYVAVKAQFVWHTREENLWSLFISVSIYLLFYFSRSHSEYASPYILCLL